MELNHQKDEIEIDLMELVMVLWRRKWLIILSGFLLALGTFLVSKFVLTDMYESSTKIYVLNRQDNDSITYSDLQSGTQLTMDYKELIVSRTVLEQVIEELELKMEYGELLGMVSVTIPSDARILTITVENANPVLARKITNTLRDAAAEHISFVMDTESVNIVEEANLPVSPSRPRVFRNTIIGGMVGIVLAIGLCLLIFILDDTIKTPEDVERYLGVSVLGTIPVSAEEKKSRSVLNRSRKKRGN